MSKIPFSRTFAPLIAGLLLAPMVLPSSMAAQTRTLSWTETSTVEVPGALGMVLRAMPGALESRTSQQSVHFQGGTLIQEDGRTATIMDADNRRFVSIDHEARTVTTFTFEESAQAAREMNTLVTEGMAGVDEAMEEVREERDAALEEMRRAMDEARDALSFRITADRTGRTRSFGDAGTATQHIITAELEAAAPPQGMDGAEAGTLIFLMELWQSPDLPTADAFYEEWGAQLAGDSEIQAMATELAGSAEAIGDASAAALAMWDPRLTAGLTEIAEAVQQIDGTTVRSIVTVALVPEGQALDRDELMAWEPESAGDRLRAEAGGAAREAAADAARGALRGLTGRFGRGGDKADEPEAEPQGVRPFFRLTTTKEDIVFGDSGEDVLGALQQRIEGYREVTMADLMREAGIN